MTSTKRGRVPEEATPDAGRSGLAVNPQLVSRYSAVMGDGTGELGGMIAGPAGSSASPEADARGVERGFHMRPLRERVRSE